eukprot:scaffold154805_cov28-Tisochrysis_lutea.AAC.3
MGRLHGNGRAALCEREGKVRERGGGRARSVEGESACWTRGSPRRVWRLRRTPAGPAARVRAPRTPRGPLRPSSPLSTVRKSIEPRGRGSKERERETSSRRLKNIGREEKKE